MPLAPSDITIAITVYDRREFIEQAIASALNQTIPVRVIVVEDCGPDPALRDFVKEKFGSRVEYFRNPRRRGLFGNWNACLEYCKTPWLSILHDDDYFNPAFIETLLHLHQAVPGRGLYFGNFVVVNSVGEGVEYERVAVSNSWQEIDLRSLADKNTLGFAGNLLNVEAAKRAGGFRSTSFFCGDWEMWFKIAAQSGGVQTGVEIVYVRYYEDWRKGTSKVIRAGQDFAATSIQRKRNYACLKQLGKIPAFNPRTLRDRTPMSVRNLIIFGSNFSPRMFRYNVGLLLANRVLTGRQKLFRMAIRMLGPGFVKALSRLCGCCRRTS